MATQVTLQAETGRDLGTAASRRLRREGKIPAVLYGMETEPLAIAVDYAAARTALTTDAGLNALLTLNLDGQEQLCLVKDLQRARIRDEVAHIDFIRVDPNSDIEVEVPLVLVGEAREVSNVSGMVDQAMFAVMISTKPTSIPNEIEVDISEMQVGDTIRVEDLQLPDGVSPAMRLQATIATAMVTRSTLEAMRAEEAAELEAEEGDAPAADAGGDDAGGDAGDGDGDG